MHRMIFSSVSSVNPKLVDGKYVTKDFISVTKYFILQELFSIKQEHQNKFGDMIICLDNAKDGYWRKQVFSAYKESRKAGRDESEVNFPEVLNELSELTSQISENLPWKVIDVPRAEADDIILVLSREFNKHEKILIHSPDKDMIQAQRNTDNVFQYSSLTKKWIVPENKHDNMDHWIVEHVCLGDASDGVPKIVDHTEFSDAFIKFVFEQGYNINNPVEFKNSNISDVEKRNLLESFDVYKTNRKGESTNVKDIFKDIRFGPTNLKKKLKEHGSLENWLDSHPMYKAHYERNYMLVMEEGIPDNIWNEILYRFKNAKTDYNDKVFEKYLIENNLQSLLLELPNHFKISRELTADDFGW
jgi:phage antirepressor YoqD-like protein